MPKNAHASLVTFTEYAFLIFKCLSEARGYDWEIMDQYDMLKGKTPNDASAS